MTGWSETTLGELIKIKNGFAFKGEYFSEHGKYVVLTPGNFHEKGGFKLRPGKDRYYQGDIPSGFVLDKNDVIVAMTEQAEGLLGSAAIVPEQDRFLHNQRLGLIQVKPLKANLHFLYYMFNTSSVRQQLRGSSSGTKIRHTSAERICNVVVRVPEPKTQQKIAAILSSYDDLIENNQRRIALLEKMAEEIYREWFVRFRFPGYEQIKFKKGMPESWEISTLGNIASFVMGQSPSSEFYNELGDGLPFHQGVGTYGDRFPKKIVFCNSEGRKAKEGDILFSVRAPVGRLNIADCEMIIGRGLAALRHKTGLNSYLFYLLKTVFADEDIIGNGSIFNSVGKDELSRLVLIKPPTDLAEEFNKIARKIDEQISNLLHANENLIKIKESLLPRAISGKLNVENLDIQFPPSMQDATP